MSSNGKTLKFRAARLKGFTVIRDECTCKHLHGICFNVFIKYIDNNQIQPKCKYIIFIFHIIIVITKILYNILLMTKILYKI